MSDDETLTKEEFEEFLNLVMLDCDIAEWCLGQLGVRLIDAGLASDDGASRYGELRAIKYLLTGAYMQAFSVPGPAETRVLVADSPEEAFKIIESNWEEGKGYPSTFMAWLYPTEKGIKWCQDLKDKNWTPPERYN